jgi:WD40 repeat protein
MSSDFEWHFGDDFPEEDTEEEQTNQPIWRRWLPWFLALVVIAGGIHIFWRGRQRNLAQAEAQVRQVAELELRALAEGDRELYLGLQDYYDRSWKRAQEAYFDTGGLPLPLHGATTSVTTSVGSARIVGDRAQVEILHTTTLPSGEEASFRALRFYHLRDDGRWLHTSVDPDVGGIIRTFVLDDIEITAFERDAEWIDPLTTNMVAGAYRFCRLASCRRSLSLELNLAANLEDAAEPDDATLPAPFLVGAPENEAARAAWEASLGQFLVDRLVARETRPGSEDDHRGALFEERLRAWLKAEIGIGEPVFPDLELVRGALEHGGLVPTWALWRVPPDDPDRSLAAAQIDLLLTSIEEDYGAPAVAGLVHALRGADHLSDVLGSIGGLRGSTIGDRYLIYLREQAAPSTDDLAAFATYDLLVGCEEYDEQGQLQTLWGWRLDRPEATLLSARSMDDGFTPISWSPSGAELLVGQQLGYGDGLSVLRAGSTEPEDLHLPNGARAVNQYGIGPSGWSAAGSRLAYRLHRTSPEPPVSESRIRHLRTGEDFALNGDFVAWSPSGARLLYARASGVETPRSDSASSRYPTRYPTWAFFVAQEDGTGDRWISDGHAAAWSPDGNRIATITPESVLRVHDVDSERRTTLLASDALQEALGFAPTFSRTYLARSITMAWSPDGEWIAVGVPGAGNEGPQEGAILLAKDSEHRVVRREAGVIYDLAWASHGRSLRALVVGEDRFASVVVGRDGALVLEEEGALATWSPDGEYLAVTRFSGESGNVETVELETGVRHQIDVPGRCQPPVWNPLAPLGSTALQ